VGGGNGAGPTTGGSGSSGPGSGSNTGGGEGAFPSQTGSSPGGSSPSGQDPQASSGMASGTKIAIAVGVTVGVLILIAALVILFFLRRRGMRRSPKAASENRFSDTSTLPKMAEAGGEPLSEVDGKAARPWSMRSELEGSRVSGDSAGVSEGGKHKEKRDLTPVAELPA